MLLFFLVIKNDSIANINVFLISSKRNAKKVTSPPALNGLYTPFDSPVSGGQKPLHFCLRAKCRGSQPYGLLSCNHTKLRYL